MKDKKIYILIFIPLVLYGVAWLLYSHHVGSNVSKISADWGYFGSYIGGVLGPLLTTASILFVWVQSKKGIEIQEKQIEQLNYQNFIRDFQYGLETLNNAEKNEPDLKISPFINAFTDMGKRGEDNFGKIKNVHRSGRADFGDMKEKYEEYERRYFQRIAALRYLYFTFESFNPEQNSLYKTYRDNCIENLDLRVTTSLNQYFIQVFDIGYGISKHNPLAS